MKRRIILVAFVLAASLSTVYIALWYTGFFEERECLRTGGTWVSVRKTCFRQ